jgi:hypothetical protein
MPVVKVTNRSHSFRNPVIDEPVGNANGDNTLQRFNGYIDGFVTVGMMKDGSSTRQFAAIRFFARST